MPCFGPKAILLAPGRLKVESSNTNSAWRVPVCAGLGLALSACLSFVLPYSIVPLTSFGRLLSSCPYFRLHPIVTHSRTDCRAAQLQSGSTACCLCTGGGRLVFTFQ